MSTNSLWNGFEERLQILESSRVEVANHNGEQTQLLLSLKEDMSEKLDVFSKSIISINTTISNGFHSLEKELNQQDKRVSNLEIELSKKEKRSAWINSLLSKILVAICSASAALVLQRFFK